MTPREGVALAPWTTLGVGGPARFFVEPASEGELGEALAWALARDLPTLILGGGSNLLVADRGFDGLVIRPRLEGIESRIESRVEAREEGAAIVEAGAGVRWDDLVAHAVSRGWAGVECLSGIPGDVGATPIQNVGAYGQEVADTLRSVRAIDRRTLAAREIDAADCGFGYRDSVFKSTSAGRFVITRVRLSLVPGGAPKIGYAELEKKLARVASPSLAAVRAAVLELRRDKSMLLDPDPEAENGKSAGSFFTNPIVDAEHRARIEERARDAGVLAQGEAMPRWPAGSRMKLSAAWLIERAGFRKGSGEGRVGISTRHSLAIVNRGGATAAEIVAFARRVRDGVRDRFAVTLGAEPVLVGFRDDEVP